MQPNNTPTRHGTNTMDMELSASQTLERELEDIRRQKQEFHLLDERERLVREQLGMVNSASAPIAINANRQPQPQQHGGLSLSPGNGYELTGRYHSSASARRATVAMTPRSQSNVGVNGLSRPDNNMAVRPLPTPHRPPCPKLTAPQRSRSSISALSHPMSRHVSQAPDLSRH
ncbi:hypothetical protein IMZ48_31805, partial [Candidatus Bathyarchaeota archaeon]|nr:hypothetical protein [Candidatus Bathyarchaeota archaeon]